MEIAAGFTELQTVLSFPPPQFQTQSQKAPAVLGSREADPSSRTGLGVPVLAHMTFAGLGVFPRLEAAPGFHLELESPAGAKSIMLG